MKSRTSFCNAALLKKTLHRGMPIWGIYLLSWLAFSPMTIISRADWMQSHEVRQYILEAVVANSHIVPALYGLAVACLVFSYLYKSRSANFFAALPLKRETHFLTNYIAGLLFALLPNLIVAGVTLLAGGMTGTMVLKEVLIWYGMSALSYVFFFSFAAFCAMLVGHLAALPILYAVLNFTVVVLEAIVKSILSTFVYGLYYNSDSALSFLSPVWHMLNNQIPDVTRIWEGDLIVGYTMKNWEYPLILFFVGIGFAVLAFLLRKGRRMESAGDIIAVNRLKPVFLYCFTIGCSLVIGWVLVAFMIGSVKESNFLPVLLCLLAGALFGFFTGQMLLHKSLRVFRKRYWVNFAVICAIITAAMLCCKLDVFGYARYVPQADQVKAVSLDYGSEQMTEDPKLIAMVIDLHQDILDQREDSERSIQLDYNRRTMYINYKLNSGKTVLRRYTIPVMSDENSLIRQYEAIYNDPEYLIEKSLPTGYKPEDIDYAFVYNWTNSEIKLTREEAYRLLKYGVEPDIRSGAMEGRHWSDNGSPTVTVEEYKALELHLELYFTGTEDKAWDGRYCSFSFNSGCVNSLKILEDLGIDTDAEEMDLTKE